jgi:hypothetical protein
MGNTKDSMAPKLGMLFVPTASLKETKKSELRGNFTYASVPDQTFKYPSIRFSVSNELPQAFELLCGIDPSLTGWSDRNWQSRIRHYVTIHPDYAMMAPWYGTETADIVYDDTEGAFTTFLIAHGYLEADEWEDRRPKYFIEIKTTTGPLCTPFYMSKRQFERVSKTMHKTNGVTKSNAA